MAAAAAGGYAVQRGGPRASLTSVVCASPLLPLVVFGAPHIVSLNNPSGLWCFLSGFYCFALVVSSSFTSLLPLPHCVCARSSTSNKSSHFINHSVFELGGLSRPSFFSGCLPDTQHNAIDDATVPREQRRLPFHLSIPLLTLLFHALSIIS